MGLKNNTSNNNVLPEQGDINAISSKRKIKVGDFCPKWLLEWIDISIVMLILGFIGCFTKGMIILFLPVGFISLVICVVIYIFKWKKYVRKIRV